MTPERLWWWSTRLHRRNLTPLAKILKLVNFLIFKAVLPYECDIRADVTLFHRGMGTVIHPNTTIGARCRIGHNVTLSVSDQAEGSEDRVVVGDDVLIGAGAFVSARGGALHIGDGAKVGVHTFVRHHVPDGATVTSPPSRIRTGSEDVPIGAVPSERE